MTRPDWIDSMHAMEIIAHRGASHEAPENTPGAFKLAWEQGADAAECDVHLSRDGQVMVIHDATTGRTTGRRGVVAGRTAAGLARLDAGSWKARRWRGECIPTLAQVLDTVPAGKRLFIEIKSGPETVAPLVPVVRHSPLGTRGAVIIGFDLRVMALAKRTMPRVPVYWGLESIPAGVGRRGWPLTTKEIIRLARAARLDGVDVDSRGPIDGRFVRELRGAGLEVFVWTVNSARVARRLARAGVAGITTDRPGWLRKALRD